MSASVCLCDRLFIGVVLGECRYPFIRIKWLVVGYDWGGIGGVIFRLVSVDIQV